MDIKRGLRWFLVAVLAYLLAICLLFLASSAVFSYIIAKPEKVKSILDNSEVYQQMPGILYENIERENQNQASDIDLSDPEIKQAALGSFSPQFFENNVETAIDGTYAWFNGVTEQPEFVIDATDARNNFIDKVVDAEAAKAKKLPACTYQQLRQIDPNSVDIYNLQCLPPGISVEGIAKQTKTELRNSQGFLGDAKINAQELKTESGDPLFSDNSELPNKFQLAKNLPAILAVFSVILAAGVYLASPDKRKGLKRIAKVLLGVGLLTLLAPIMIQLFSGKLLPVVSTDKLVSQIVAPVVSQFNSATMFIYWLIGGVLALGGVLLFIAIHKNIFKFPEAKK